MRIKKGFLINGFALSLSLKQRLIRQLGSILGPGSRMGQKGKQQGHIGKILAWEEVNPFPSPDYLSARFAGDFFFCPHTDFFLLFPPM